MAADMRVYFDFGGIDGTPGTEQDTEALGPPNIRFKRADNATIDSNNPMTIPAAGTNYSRWKQVYLYCASAPSSQINNVRFYSDGTAYGTGITVKVGEQFPVKTNASNAGYEVADTDDQEMVASHGGITSSVDVATIVVGAPLTVTIGESGGIINAIGETCQYVVLQMEVINTASPGDIANRTLYFKYDEI